MKNFLFFLMALISFSAFAYNPVDCALETEKTTRIAEVANGTEAVTILCQGASNNLPIKCAIDAGKRLHANPGTEVEVAILCRGAKSNAPVDCVLDALKRTQISSRGTTKQVATLCSGTK